MVPNIPKLIININELIVYKKIIKVYIKLIILEIIKATNIAGLPFSYNKSKSIYLLAFYLTLNQSVSPLLSSLFYLNPFISFTSFWLIGNFDSNQENDIFFVFTSPNYFVNKIYT